MSDIDYEHEAKEFLKRHNETFQGDKTPTKFNKNTDTSWKIFAGTMKHVEKLVTEGKTPNPTIIEKLSVSATDLLIKTASFSDSEEKTAASLRFANLLINALRQTFEADIKSQQESSRYGALAFGAINMFGGTNNATYRIIEKWTGRRNETIKRDYLAFKNSSEHWLNHPNNKTAFLNTYLTEIASILVESKHIKEVVVSTKDEIMHKIIIQLVEHTETILKNPKIHTLEREPFAIRPNFEHYDELQKKITEYLKTVAD